MNAFRFSFKNQTLDLHPYRAIYWQEQKILLIADVHLGKAAHFRKKGLAAPAALFQKNISNLEVLLRAYQPERILFLGDLFHSTMNNTWIRFTEFILKYPHVSFELVQGNHDILPSGIYESAQLEVYTEPLIIESFVFSHYPLSEVPDGLYNFYGHIHPGVLLEGPGKQELRLACFHFGKQQAVLPAFGSFTGLAIVQPVNGDKVFVIAEQDVMEVN